MYLCKKKSSIVTKQLLHCAKLTSTVVSISHESFPALTPVATISIMTLCMLITWVVWLAFINICVYREKMHQWSRSLPLKIMQLWVSSLTIAQFSTVSFSTLMFRTFSIFIHHTDPVNLTAVWIGCTCFRTCMMIGMYCRNQYKMEMYLLLIVQLLCFSVRSRSFRSRYDTRKLHSVPGCSSYPTEETPVSVDVSQTSSGYCAKQESSPCCNNVHGLIDTALIPVC